MYEQWRLFPLKQYINTLYSVFGNHSLVIHFLLKPAWHEVALASFQNRLISITTLYQLQESPTLCGGEPTPLSCLPFILPNSVL